MIAVPGADDRATWARSGAEVAGSRKTDDVRHAEVRYAERDGDYLAFTVFGDGPIDLAVPQSRVPIDLMWEWPQLATFMETLGRMARVITYDVRGFGASDPVLDPTVASAEGFADDIRTVLHAADSRRIRGGRASSRWVAVFRARCTRPRIPSECTR